MTGSSGDIRPGMQGVVFLSTRAARNRSASWPRSPGRQWAAARLRPCSSMVADLSGRCEDLDWPPSCVGHFMQLRLHASLRATDQTPTRPFFNPGIAAARCALRSAASIEITVLSGACAASPVMIRANTRISLHLFRRLQSVFCGPCSRGASRHRNPLRRMKPIPRGAHRPSTRGTPWLSGQQGHRRAIRASRSHYGLPIKPALVRGL